MNHEGFLKSSAVIDSKIWTVPSELTEVVHPTEKADVTESRLSFVVQVGIDCLSS